jgi:hypothetical protein
MRTQSTEEVLKNERDRVKEVYRFAEWAGKVKKSGLIEALVIDPAILGNLGKVQVLTPANARSTNLGLILRGPEDHPILLVAVLRLESPLAAHELLVSDIAGSTAPQPSSKRVRQGPEAEIGDVCFLPNGKWRPKGNDTPVLGLLTFSRNNVYVRLDQREEGKAEYWDLLEIAKRIDQRLLEALPKEEAKPPAAEKAKESSGGAPPAPAKGTQPPEKQPPAKTDPPKESPPPAAETPPKGTP